jgi:hypothetical protein
LINFEGQFLTDSIGNESLSKSKSLEVLIDTIAPLIEVGETEFQDVKVENNWFVQTTTSFRVSESSLEFSDFVFDGPNQCNTDFEQKDRAISLQTFRCPEGQVQWLLPSHSITDIAGNSAPSEDLIIELLIPAEKVDPPKLPEEVIPEEPEPENPEQPEQPEKPELDNPEQTEPENPTQNQPDDREQPESEIDEPIASTNPDAPAQQPSPPSETENPGAESPSEEEKEFGDSVEVDQPDDASIEQPNDPVQEAPMTEAEQPSSEAEQQSSEAEQESDLFEEGAKEVAESDSNVGVSVPELQERSPEEARSDIGSETTIPVSQPREFSDIEENDETSVWAILLAGLLVLGLIFGVVLLTKNNGSRAIE